MSTSKSMTRISTAALLALVAACAQQSADNTPPTAPDPDVQAPPAADAETAAAPDINALLAQAIVGTHRKEGNADRNQYRHPEETLAFFGLQPNMTVVELWPGGGWYTEILAPALKGHGKLVVTNYDEASDNDYRKRSAKRFNEFIATNPEMYGEVEVRVVRPPDDIDLGPEGSADLVLTFRNSHGWVEDSYEDRVYGAAYKVLKPGGILGVVQHRGKDDADARKTAESGYVPQPYLIGAIEKVGFKLVEKSDINANPKDTKDHVNGVWTLPPGLSVVAKDKKGKPKKISDEKKAELEAKSKAIGESDRMTLKFKKPS